MTATRIANTIAICRPRAPGGAGGGSLSTGAGAAGGALFTWLVSHYFSLHPMLIFTLAAFAYITALVIFQLLVPRLGVNRAT